MFPRGNVRLSPVSSPALLDQPGWLLPGRGHTVRISRDPGGVGAGWGQRLISHHLTLSQAEGGNSIRIQSIFEVPVIFVQSWKQMQIIQTNFLWTPQMCDGPCREETLNGILMELNKISYSYFDKDHFSCGLSLHSWVARFIQEGKFLNMFYILFVFGKSLKQRLTLTGNS